MASERANSIQQKTSFKLNPGAKEFDIKGCLVSNNKLLFLDRRNKRLLMHNTNGEHLEDIALSAEPFGIALIDREVAITYGREKYIEFIDLDTKNVRKVTKGGNCWGIAVYGMQLFMIVELNRICIEVMSELGGTVKLIKINMEFDQAEYLTVDKHNLYLTTFFPRRLVCLDLDGKVQWIYDKNNFNQPRGVTTDTTGNVLMVGFSSHNVVRVNPTTKVGEEIINNDDGLSYPTAIHCDEATSRLLVCNLSDGNVFLYNIM